mmetsp:Transcript_25550/g.35113  ORF Transcript_25550/g.35113 Transcript_25550/m.35113 type:complete len:95 (-) Transcript_25550:377-661(-)
MNQKWTDSKNSWKLAGIPGSYKTTMTTGAKKKKEEDEAVVPVVSTTEEALEAMRMASLRAAAGKQVGEQTTVRDLDPEIELSEAGGESWFLEKD